MREVLVIDFEVDVETVEHPRVREIANYVLDHLVIAIALPRAVVGRLLAHLDPCGVKRHILVLEGAYENDVLEVLKTGGAGKLIERRLFDGLSVGHAELDEAFTLSPLLEEPHASIKELVGVVHVAHMRRREAHVGVELVFELHQ